ncbi:MAG: hypothetical protein AAGF78_10875 [Pseudomonadota bacterium]
MPFEIAPEASPEAAIVEPMAHGSFLATLKDYWDLQDHPDVRRSRAWGSCQQAVT